MKIDKKIDIEHSIYIRLKNTDDTGWGTCYTCGIPIHYKMGQCGHYPYASRENMLLRWDKHIHKFQCRDCNEINDGCPDAFRDGLINEMGAGSVSKVEFVARKPFKWTRSEKEAILRDFKQLNKQLRSEKMF